MDDITVTAPVPEALAGLRVLELGGGHAAAFAARLLADLGAEVIKVETPGGDPVRGEGPRLRGDSQLEGGALFEYLNWNKASLCLDPADGPAAVAELAATASLVLTGDDVDVLSGWGLDPATVLSIRTGLVLTTVTPFGACGPDSWWRSSDLVVQATGGLMAFSGTWDREPLKRGLRQTSYTAGLTAAYASLAACLFAGRSGRGVHVDVSRQEVIAAELILNAPTYTYMGAVQGRRSAAKDPFTGEPIPARDCFATVQTNTWTTLPMFAELLGEPRLCEERFDTREKRGFNAGPLTEILTEALRDVAGRDLFVRAARADMLAGFTQTAQQLLSCPQLAARGVFREVPGAQGALGRWRFPAVLAGLSATPTAVRSGAPALGERGAELAASWLAAGSTTPASPPAPMTPTVLAAPAAPRRPLEGLKIIDLSTVFAVRYIGAMLSDLGAEVVKVEAPTRLDQSRSSFGASFDNQPAGEYWNRAATFQGLNRGKRSVVLDLSTPAGRAASACPGQPGRRAPRQLHPAGHAQVGHDLRRAGRGQPTADHAVQHRLRVDRPVGVIQGPGHHARGDDGPHLGHRLRRWRPGEGRAVLSRFPRLLDRPACSSPRLSPVTRPAAASGSTSACTSSGPR